MLPLLIGQNKCCVACREGKRNTAPLQGVQLIIHAVSCHHMAVVADRFRRVRLPIVARTVNRLISLVGRKKTYFWYITVFILNNNLD